jgi:hypothetical protein
MDILSDVTRELARNMGGGKCEIYMVLHSDIDVFPSKPEDDGDVSMEDLAKLVGDYDLKANKKWTILRAIEDTVLVQQEEQGEIDGMSNKNSVTFSIAGNDAQALGLAERTNNRKVVLLVPDKMGRVRAIGSEACGAFRQAQTHGTGTAAADRAMVTLQFAYYDFGPAPIYEGDIDLDASGSGSGA